jgi:DNA mismatch repair ATPase MutL
MSTLIGKGKMEYGETDIGVNLLESITLGLYRFPFNVIREYIQNEIDARPRPEKLEVRIAGQDVFVVGDGSGMSWSDVLEAKKVGISPKSSDTDAGFRGIGIFSGVAVCREVVIETHKRHDNEKVILRMDADGLRKEILSGSNRPLLQALEEHISFERHHPENDAKAFGTTVQLRSILPEQESPRLDGWRNSCY